MSEGNAEKLARNVARLAKERKGFVIGMFQNHIPLIGYPNMGEKEIADMLTVASELIHEQRNNFSDFTVKFKK